MACPPDSRAPAVLSIFTSIISGLIAIAATSGNALIILTVTWDPLRTLHEPFNYFLVNLAVSDLILGAFTMPLACYYHYQESKGQTNSKLLVLLHFSYFISSCGSLLSFLALCIDRYIAIAKAISYRQYLSWSRCLLVSIFIWVISFSFPLIYIKLGYIGYLMVFGNLAVSSGLAMLLIIYLRVYFYLKRQTSMMEKYITNPTSSSRYSYLQRLTLEKKITRVFLLMLLVFVVTYIPALLMIYILHFCHTCACTTHNILRDVLILCINFNCCINPFIFTLRLTTFRQAVKRIYEKLTFCMVVKRATMSSVTVEESSFEGNEKNLHASVVNNYKTNIESVGSNNMTLQSISEKKNRKNTVDENDDAI